MWWPTMSTSLMVYGICIALSAAASLRARQPEGGHGRNGSKQQTLFRFWVFAALALVAAITLRPVSWPSHRFTNLVPVLRILDIAPGDSTIENLGGNIALFVPLGLAFGLAWPGTSKRWNAVQRAALVGLVVSLLVEAIQFTVPTGRVADVDDLLLNTLGSALGGWLAAALGAKSDSPFFRKPEWSAHEACNNERGARTSRVRPYVLDRRFSPASSRIGVVMEDYCGPATISDGTTESLHDVEIHTRASEHARAAAWHAIITGRLPAELRSPYGKALFVRLPSGGQGVGVLVDPHLLRGAGDPPQ